MLSTTAYQNKDTGKLLYHMYTLWLVSCSFLRSRKYFKQLYEIWLRWLFSTSHMSTSVVFSRGMLLMSPKLEYKSESFISYLNPQKEITSSSVFQWHNQRWQGPALGPISPLPYTIQNNTYTQLVFVQFSFTKLTHTKEIYTQHTALLLYKPFILSPW